MNTRFEEEERRLLSGQLMPFRRFLFAAFIAALALGSVESHAAAAERARSTSTREPPRTPPVVPGVIVLGAIAAAVVRMNRRGPR